MSKSNHLKPIEIGYGDEKVIFHLRMISIAEEETISRKFADLADSTEKYQKEFEICKEALGEFSISMPQRLEKVKGEFVKKPLAEAETAAGAIDTFFKERTPEKERIVRDAYFMFKRLLSPDGRFLDFSA